MNRFQFQPTNKMIFDLLQRIKLNLSKMLCSNKPKTDKKDTEIYIIQCLDRLVIYIGQTRRDFDIKFKEHKRQSI